MKKEYVIDCVSNEKYYVVTRNGEPFTMYQKKINKLENIINLIGEENIFAIIMEEENGNKDE